MTPSPSPAEAQRIIMRLVDALVLSEKRFWTNHPAATHPTSEAAYAAVKAAIADVVLARQEPKSCPYENAPGRVCNKCGGTHETMPISDAIMLAMVRSAREKDA